MLHHLSTTFTRSLPWRADLRQDGHRFTMSIRRCQGSPGLDLGEVPKSLCAPILLALHPEVVVQHSEECNRGMSLRISGFCCCTRQAKPKGSLAKVCRVHPQRSRLVLHLRHHDLGSKQLEMFGKVYACAFSWKPVHWVETSLQAPQRLGASSGH